jgi:hypothetical protein
MNFLDIVRITVEILPGSDYHTALQQMIDLATQVGCPVTADTSAGQITVTEWSTVEQVMEKYFS